MTSYRKRTRLFIARRFQIKYISLILVFMFATAVATGYMVYVTTWIMFGEKLAAVYPQGLLLDIVKQVNMVLLMRLIFLVPLVVLVGLVLSHRIAGPIYRIRQHVLGLIQGDYETPLRLREKDEMKDLADSVDRLTTCLREERDNSTRSLEGLMTRIDDLEAAIIAGSDENKEKMLKEILDVKEEVNKLRRK